MPSLYLIGISSIGDEPSTGPPEMTALGRSITPEDVVSFQRRLRDSASARATRRTPTSATTPTRPPFQPKTKAAYVRNSHSTMAPAINGAGYSRSR